MYILEILKYNAWDISDNKYVNMHYVQLDIIRNTYVFILMVGLCMSIHLSIHGWY